MLLEAEVSVAENEDCKIFYEQITDITESMICIKVEDGKGTCSVSDLLFDFILLFGNVDRETQEDL